MHPLASKDSKFSDENNIKITALSISSNPRTKSDPVHRETAATQHPSQKQHTNR